MILVNISFYRFVDLAKESLPPLRIKLKEECAKLELKGTILLAPEGINGFLSGTGEQIDAFHKVLETIDAFKGIEFKKSPSEKKPFKRMLVKLKKEIITMGMPEISPAKFTAPRVKPQELVEWMKNGKKVIFLDTRNDYEIRLGTFKNAIDMNLQTFRQFPEKLKELPEELKEKTVVTFCTGGIRCEKASAVMANAGYKDVYQLDGGILKHFEEAGGDHYEGDCFVFDYRVSVRKDLETSDAVLCYRCQNPVTREEQRSPFFKVNLHCPHCYNKEKFHKEKIAERIKAETSC